MVAATLTLIQATGTMSALTLTNSMDHPAKEVTIRVEEIMEYMEVVVEEAMVVMEIMGEAIKVKAVMEVVMVVMEVDT